MTTDETSAEETTTDQTTTDQTAADETSADDAPTGKDPLRGAIGVLGVVLGVAWAVELGSRGVHAGILFELLPPLALTFVGTVYARRHLLDGSS